MATRFPKISSKNICKWERSSITYSLDTGIASDSLTATASYTTVSSATGSATSNMANASGNNPSSVAASTWLPCHAAAVLENQDTEIYIPFSHAQALCQSSGMNQSITSVLPENKRQRKPGKRQAAIPINKLLHLPPKPA